MNDRVMLFAGTAEGRELYEYLLKKGIPADVYTATGYGRKLLEAGRGTKGAGCRSGVAPEPPLLHAGRLTETEIGKELQRCLALLPAEEGTLWVIDATHPYASEVTVNIRSACEKASGEPVLRLLRLVRPRGGGEAEEAVSGPEAMGEPKTVPSKTAVWVRDAAEAAAYVSRRPGNVLVTTGSKELAAFTAVNDYQSRVFVRLLPLSGIVELAEKLGFSGRQLYCMQGPFSADMNELLLRETGSRYLVTKEAGREGGFPEKLAAAKRAGAVCVIIRRPSSECGHTLEEIMQLLEKALR